MHEMRRQSILVVDDDPILRSVLAEVFESLGFQVFCAGSGNEAFRIFRRRYFELVLSDIEMPDGDGHQLVRNIRNFTSLPPQFILMSSNPGKADVGSEAEFFPKPLDLCRLVLRCASVNQQVFPARASLR